MNIEKENKTMKKIFIFYIFKYLLFILNIDYKLKISKTLY